MRGDAGRHVRFEAVVVQFSPVFIARTLMRPSRRGRLVAALLPLWGPFLLRQLVSSPYVAATVYTLGPCQPVDQAVKSSPLHLLFRDSPGTIPGSNAGLAYLTHTIQSMHEWSRMCCVNHP